MKRSFQNKVKGRRRQLYNTNTFIKIILLQSMQLRYPIDYAH